MGLINVPAVSTNDLADENFFNSRFGAIADEINGQLDADNLDTNAVTTPKITDKAVTSDKIGTPVSFKASLSGSQATSAGVAAKVDFDTEDFDYGGNYDTGNQRFTAPTDGLYMIGAVVNQPDGGTLRQEITVYKNGSVAEYLYDGDMETFRVNGGSVLMELSATDYVEIYFENEGSDSISSAYSTFWGYRVGRTD